MPDSGTTICVVTVGFKAPSEPVLPLLTAACADAAASVASRKTAEAPRLGAWVGWRVELIMEWLLGSGLQKEEVARSREVWEFMSFVNMGGPCQVTAA